MHAQRMRVVVCATALHGAVHGMLRRARVMCVWRAAHTEAHFVISPGRFSIEGFGVLFVFFGTGTRRLL